MSVAPKVYQYVNQLVYLNDKKEYLGVKLGRTETWRATGQGFERIGFWQNLGEKFKGLLGYFFDGYYDRTNKDLLQIQFVVLLENSENLDIEVVKKAAEAVGLTFPTQKKPLDPTSKIVFKALTDPSKVNDAEKSVEAACARLIKKYGLKFKLFNKEAILAGLHKKIQTATAKILTPLQEALEKKEEKSKKRSSNLEVFSTVEQTEIPLEDKVAEEQSHNNASPEEKDTAESNQNLSEHTFNEEEKKEIKKSSELNKEEDSSLVSGHEEIEETFFIVENLESEESIQDIKTPPVAEKEKSYHGGSTPREIITMLASVVGVIAMHWLTRSDATEKGFQLNTLVSARQPSIFKDFVQISLHSKHTEYGSDKIIPHYFEVMELPEDEERVWPCPYAGKGSESTQLQPPYPKTVYKEVVVEPTFLEFTEEYARSHPEEMKNFSFDDFIPKKNEAQIPVEPPPLENQPNTAQFSDYSKSNIQAAPAQRIRSYISLIFKNLLIFSGASLFAKPASVFWVNMKEALQHAFSKKLLNELMKGTLQDLSKKRHGVIPLHALLAIQHEMTEEECEAFVNAKPFDGLSEADFKAACDCLKEKVRSMAIIQAINETHFKLYKTNVELIETYTLDNLVETLEKQHEMSEKECEVFASRNPLLKLNAQDLATALEHLEEIKSPHIVDSFLYAIAKIQRQEIISKPTICNSKALLRKLFEKTSDKKMLVSEAIELNFDFAQEFISLAGGQSFLPILHCNEHLCEGDRKDFYITFLAIQDALKEYSKSKRIDPTIQQDSVGFFDLNSESARELITNLLEANSEFILFKEADYELLQQIMGEHLEVVTPSNKARAAPKKFPFIQPILDPIVKMRQVKEIESRPVALNPLYDLSSNYDWSAKKYINFFEIKEIQGNLGIWKVENEEMLYHKLAKKNIPEHKLVYYYGLLSNGDFCVGGVPLKINKALVDEKGNNALMIAIERGKYKLAHAMIESGGFPNHPNSTGDNVWRVLLRKADSGCEECGKLLQLYREKELMPEQVSQLFRASPSNFDENAFYSIGYDNTQLDGHGNNVLMLAIQNGHYSVAKKIVETSECPNYLNIKGQTTESLLNEKISHDQTKDWTSLLKAYEEKQQRSSIKVVILEAIKNEEFTKALSILSEFKDCSPKFREKCDELISTAIARRNSLLLDDIQDVKILKEMQKIVLISKVFEGSNEKNLTNKLSPFIDKLSKRPSTNQNDETICKAVDILCQILHKANSYKNEISRPKINTVLEAVECVNSLLHSYNFLDTAKGKLLKNQFLELADKRVSQDLNTFCRLLLKKANNSSKEISRQQTSTIIEALKWVNSILSSYKFFDVSKGKLLKDHILNLATKFLEKQKGETERGDNQMRPSLKDYGEESSSYSSSSEYSSTSSSNDENSLDEEVKQKSNFLGIGVVGPQILFAGK